MLKLSIRLLTLALVLLGVPVGVSAQDITVVGAFTGTGTSTMENVLNIRVTFSRLTWSHDGTATVCSFKVEESDDGITWTDLTPAQDCTSPGKFELISSPFVGKFVRHNLTAFTGSGILRTFWDGFQGTACGMEYRGIFTVETSADPVAGAELSIVVPADERWRIYSFSFELETDGTPGDREAFINKSEGSKRYYRAFGDGVVKANQTGIFTTASIGFVGTVGLGPSSINQPTDVRTIMIPTYSDTFVQSGDTIFTETGGLQAGDDYSPAQIFVERCPS